MPLGRPTFSAGEVRPPGDHRPASSSCPFASPASTRSQPSRGSIFSPYFAATGVGPCSLPSTAGSLPSTSGRRQAKETLPPGWTSWRERGCQGTLVANPFPDVSAGSPERHRKSLPQPISRRRGEVSLPLQCRNPHLSCRHGVHADSVGRPSESVLPDRTLSTLRALPALSRNAGGEAGEVARAGCEPGGTRRRERDLCPTQPHAE